MVEMYLGLLGADGWLFRFIAIMLAILTVTLPLLLAVALAVYADRKVWAAVQMRRGPNVVGPFGILQSFADGLKLFLKETIIPAGANKVIFLLAPMITFTLALIAWAVIPFDKGMAIADLNIGLLYVLAISSLGVYGVIMSGWASNSRYAFLGSLRSAAQMVSYEVSIGFVLVTVLLGVGSLNLQDIVEAQAGPIWNWHVWPFLPAFFIFLISALAETNRPPFDLPEAEAELVAGYQVEYSSMAFALFFLGEYANILLMSALMAVLFFGGWYAPLPGLDILPGAFWMLAKTAVGFFVFALIKAFVPRYRYDQLMRLGWKVFLPLSLAMVVIYAGVMLAFDWLPK
ncbi:NADH-quinone oxidoreductase subunit NuoH [Yunchengibacter salinarum]|uniref:NADH-quinone oxidoreductase subunit NuoH n=1 Tax=Yunchengibacter salinarum TaxID=3133399 RepID=UPI0035B699D8